MRRRPLGDGTFVLEFTPRERAEVDAALARLEWMVARRLDLPGETAGELADAASRRFGLRVTEREATRAIDPFAGLRGGR